MSENGKDTTVEDLAPSARKVGAETFAALVDLMREAESESVKLAAVKEILDRGYGRTATVLPTPQDVQKPTLPQRLLWTYDPDRAIPDPSKLS